MKVLVSQSRPALSDSMGCSLPLCLGFSRQECWSGLPFPVQATFSTQGLTLSLLHCKQILCHLSHQGSPSVLYLNNLMYTFFLFKQDKLKVFPPVIMVVY